MPRYQPSISNKKNKTDRLTRIVSARSSVCELSPRRNNATNARLRVARMATRKMAAITIHAAVDELGGILT